MFHIHIYPKILFEKVLTYKTCPKWDFEQFDEKTQEIKVTTDN